MNFMLFLQTANESEALEKAFSSPKSTVKMYGRHFKACCDCMPASGKSRFLSEWFLLFDRHKGTIMFQNGEVFVNNLKEEVVRSPLNVMELMKQGEGKASYYLKLLTLTLTFLLCCVA